MKLRTDTANGRYSPFSITLHWLMLLLLVSVYACIELREVYPKGSDPREALKTWHFMLGLSVFLLVWLRVVGRILTPAPRIIPPLPKWQQLITKGFHWLLYAFMLGMPIVGWLILSAEGEAAPFFGLELPMLTEKNEGLADTMEEIHETVGTLGYFVIGIHAIAALVHHYIRRDNTLVRMLPRSASLGMERPAMSRNQSGDC